MSNLGVLWKKMVSSWSVWGFWEWADSLRELQRRAKSSSYFYQVVILQREADVRLKEEQEREKKRVKVKMFHRTVETDNSHAWYGTHQIPAELVSRSMVEDVQAVGSMIQFGVTAPDLTLQFLYFFGLIRNVITDLKVKGSHRMMSSKEKNVDSRWLNSSALTCFLFKSSISWFLFSSWIFFLRASSVLRCWRLWAFFIYKI